eukprot:7016871-Prymnesium_polylepis.1
MVFSASNGAGGAASRHLCMAGGARGAGRAIARGAGTREQAGAQCRAARGGSQGRRPHQPRIGPDSRREWTRGDRRNRSSVFTL